MTLNRIDKNMIDQTLVNAVDSHSADIDKFNNQSGYTEHFVATEGQSLFTLDKPFDHAWQTVEVEIEGIGQDEGDNFTKIGSQN